MNNMQDIISKALELWSREIAESTVRCRDSDGYFILRTG